MTTEELTKELEAVWDLLVRSHDKKTETSLRLLHEHLANPRSYVSFCGETSSGKSTLINSFLGERLLVAGAKPTTGTVVWIEHGLVEQRAFSAVFSDGQMEPIDYEQFAEYSQRPTADILRLKAEIPEKVSGCRGLTVFDTPGFNSIISEHEEVLKNFLPESDVIVFVVNYRVGFGACDQHLMEVIGGLREVYGETPVRLVVNRVPEDVTAGDGRVREIVSHAEDSLHGKVGLSLVRSASVLEDGSHGLPESSELWRDIREVAFAPERLTAIVEHGRHALCELVENRLAEIDGTLAAAMAGADCIPALEEELQYAEQDRVESCAIVDKYMARLSTVLPRLVLRESESLINRISGEISDASKWTDAGICQATISGHVIPFGTCEIARQVSECAYSMFVEMDKEISDKANKAFRRIEEKVKLTDDPSLRPLLQNLGLKLGKKIAGEAASNVLKNLGGCAGSAAGMGNLAKMIVKKIGSMLGKKFGKEVYTQIGKIFTKRMMKGMGMALQALVEVVDWVVDCETWQKRLSEKAAEVVRGWAKDTVSEMEEKMIPEYRKNNYATVNAWYDERAKDISADIEDAKRKIDAREIDALKNDRELLAAALGSLKERK